jgi:hypothetical protein
MKCHACLAGNSRRAIAAVIMFDSSWNMVQFSSAHTPISKASTVQKHTHYRALHLSIPQQCDELLAVFGAAPQ